ncbi:FAD-binding oxidoreductase [Bradyrhizobium sp. LHD-71]|uniref:NAD(P)/FAD-dependent oxidoreductase n=1 Tax=Bradyrhizobium sp. LHD-71 TaxID=3072141 RepID=UPI00280FB980|nr:FAD-binding oxidoreductase [Bradyrhizobium sp. LHD-71]MDQ8727156.1 FAD-binding oxidoreductase [Bradyrhizobium sp. LHD-71]
MSSNDKKPVVVIGGGIMGLSAAIWLLRSGRAVTLIDPGIARRPASFGNAGVLAACSVVPVTAPGLIAKIPMLLLDPNSPLFVRWSYLPKLAPWLVRYLKHANAADTARISKGLAQLTRDTYAQHKALAGGTPAERWLQSSGYFFAYRSRAAFEADAFAWQLRREAGFIWQEFEGAALRDVDPALGSKVGLGILVKDHGFVLSPGGYVADLREVAASLGASALAAEARAFRFEADGALQAVVTTDGEIETDAAVVATGAWSKMLTAQLGLNVPLESERGYHVMLYGASLKPRQPTSVISGKFVATPMADGVRCAGIVEFGGLDLPPHKPPIELMLRQVKDAFPALTFTHYDEWLGHRPAPSDSLPLIGEVPRHRGIFLAFGHHHVGLTTGPKTGRLLAALVNGETPELDMTPYTPARFAA